MKFGLLERCPIFQASVLFGFGDNDWEAPFFTKGYSEMIEAPHKAFGLIKSAGHSTALDQPGKFAKRLMETAYNALFALK